MAVGLAGCAGSGNGGITGAAPARYMGERPNVNGTYNGATASSSMLKQQIKEDEYAARRRELEPRGNPGLGRGS